MLDLRLPGSLYQSHLLMSGKPGLSVRTLLFQACADIRKYYQVSKERQAYSKYFFSFHLWKMRHFVDISASSPNRRRFRTLRSLRSYIYVFHLRNFAGLIATIGRICLLTLRMGVRYDALP
jgi:hypothetical protein